MPAQRPSRPTDTPHGVRRLGFGVSGSLGSKMFSGRKAHDLIIRAYEGGVRYFDTGPSYGDGEAERRLGDALQRLPRFELIISTKAGVTATGVTSRGRDFSPDAIRRSLDESMKRLRLQRLDWFFLHGPDPAELTGHLLKTLADIRFSGQVARLGVAGRGPELDAAVETGLFSLIMAPVHAALPQPDLDRLSRIRASGAELVGFSALTPALPRYPAPTSFGSARTLARNILHAPPEPSVRLAPQDALKWALGPGGAGRVLATTTQPHHLDALIRTVELAPALLDPPSKQA